MIPKTIHYCWFGRNPKPKLAEKCIKSWEKYCPDYEIVEWNEDNFDIASAPLYVRQAYEAKKWAFVTDYVRLKVVYDHGGIYLDTDVEVVKPLDQFLQHRAYFGFEAREYVNTGLGFGSEKGLPLLSEMMEEYEQEPFLLDNGSYNEKTCPIRNTEVFQRYGLVRENREQKLIGDIVILPTEYFCPFITGSQMKRTKNTATIHWYSGSWLPDEEAKQREKWLNSYNRHRREAIVKKAVKKLIGERRYQSLKVLLGRK